MDSDELDRVDRGILHLLQDDARDVTTEAIGQEIGVAASTVAARIRDLENEGVITGYGPFIDYERAGYDSRVLVIGTIPSDESKSFVNKIADVGGVVSVRELMTDAENVSIELIGETQDVIEGRIAELTDLGVDIVRTEMIKQSIRRPFDGFGKEVPNPEPD